MRALILAGGFATRLGPIGEAMPKAMITVEGDTVLGHILRKLEKLGVEPLITTNKRFEPFFRGYPNVLIEEATREEEKLGAVSAIANAIERAGIEDDLLVICVDNYFSSDLKGFISSYTGEPLVGIYYVGEHPDMRAEEMATVKFEGSERYPPPSRSFYIQDFREKVKPPISQYVSTGIYVLPKRVFPILRSYCAAKKQDAPGFFIQHLLQLGERMKGYLLEGEWYDVSHKSYLQTFREAKLVKNDRDAIRCERDLGGALLLSLTILHAGCVHVIQGGDRVCFFVDGEGEMKVGEKIRRVRGKDVIEIESGTRAEIRNASGRDLIFVSVGTKGKTP